MMPELMNCPHSPGGWCLACVAGLHSQWDAMKTVADAAADTANKEAMALVAFRQAVADALDALREKLEAIARVKQEAGSSITDDVEARYLRLAEAAATSCALGMVDATIAKLGLAEKEQANVSA